MSKLVNGVSVIEEEPDFICSECGAIAETRPYGKDGAEICASCGDKIPDIVKHNMGIKLFGNRGELM